jgi:hypothetical protein
MMQTLYRLGLFLLFLTFYNPVVDAQNVIIVVVDGARYSETFGADGTYIPHLYNDLKPLGTLFTNYRIDYPSGLTETCPGHSAIETGTWQPIDNNGNERPDMPTVFEYLRKEKGNPQSDCYVVSGKDKLDILTYSTHDDYGSDYGGIWVGDDDRDDEQTYDEVISVLQNYQPKILVINFAQVDDIGHDGNWNGYLSAITAVDNYIYQLWQHIENGDWGYTPQNTTMFIMNDHGRHDDQHGGFQHHGDGCNGCEHIMLLALGRGILPDQIIDTETWQIDIAPTVGELLDFETPLAEGTSLLEIPTIISSDENSDYLSNFLLEQNFPNPFNSSTVISFSVYESGFINLQIYDVLGNTIATLVNEEKNPGNYRVTFNSPDLSSGMYFYKLTTASSSETKKMILIK